MATDPANLPKPEKVAAALLCDLFLEHSHKHRSHDCYVNYRHLLWSFCTAYGRLPAAGLKPFHVTKWLGRRVQHDAPYTGTTSPRRTVSLRTTQFRWAPRAISLTIAMFGPPQKVRATGQGC
jgi:hypothetical protein